MTSRIRSVSLLLALGLPAAGPAPARAADPVTFAGGRVRLAGGITGTISPWDRGYFNYTDYNRSTLRGVRLELAAEAALAPRVALVGELRMDAPDVPHAHAAYLRVRPWKGRELDLQAGRIPPVFGAYARRAYGPDDPLLGVPLAYHYLTTLRADAFPATVSQLVAARGFGWRVRYPLGSGEAAPGMPLVSADRWDVGIEARAGRGPLSLSAAVTQGTLGRPRVDDDNHGKQLSVRLAWRPGPAVGLGLSGARGAYLARVAEDDLPVGSRSRTYRQQAIGVDADYAAGHWILRGEAVWNRWDVPPMDPRPAEHALEAIALSVEARYKLAPGLLVALRGDHLGFERIAHDGGLVSWDAPVSRLELGGGYSLRRDLVLKASYQWNTRDGGPLHSRHLPSLQLRYWF